MPGFIVTINSRVRIANSNENDCEIQSMSTDNCAIERRSSMKFQNDKFLYETEDCILCIDGVVFNNHQLMNAEHVNDWTVCVYQLYKKSPTTFYNVFRGSFCGFVHNKIDNSWIFYTDHIGDKQVFYAKVDDGWIVGTELSYIIDTFKLNGLSMSPNIDAAYMLASIGYVIEDNTLINEVKKIFAGHYISINSGRIEDIPYHVFKNVPTDISLSAAVEKIDQLFRNAVMLQFEKDNEYGYKHLTCLSGGLDSRMTVWVAHELGYKQQLNVTFCQSNYADFKIAQKIASDLRHDFIYKTLDNGNCLYDIDVVTKLSCGQACYFGLSHSYSLFSKLLVNDYGIVHSGMLGDVILSSFFSTMEYNISAQIGDAAYSSILLNKLSSYKFHFTYENSEIYKLYNRGFGSCGQGALAYSHTKTETYSPFCDVDFMEFCWSIPLKLRFNHKIYFDWILSKYPGAAKYVWDYTGKLIHSFENKDYIPPKYQYVFGHRIPAITNPDFINYIGRFILRHLGFYEYYKKKRNNILAQEHMNPIDYWFYTNDELRTFMHSYMVDNMKYISDENLRTDLYDLYDNNSTFEKLETLSVLSAYKLIFKNNQY